jgi:hypothetical protein
VTSPLTMQRLCAACGAYVPSGVSHICPGPVLDQDLTPQIAAALDRIADALDRLVP